MPNLIVQPINLDAPGSYRERKEYLTLLRDIRASSEERNPGLVLDLLARADELVRSRLRTEDGSPVEPLLDQLSASQFDDLLSAIAFETGVGEAKGLTSSESSEVSPAPSPPTGS